MSATGLFNDGGVARGAEYAPASDTAIHRISTALGKNEAPWWIRGVSYAAIGVVAYVLLWVLRPVITPIAAALAAAYFVSPVVDRLEKTGVSRSVSIVAILLFFSAAVAGVFAILIPLVGGEVERLVASAPEYWSSFNSWVDGTLRPWVEKTFPGRTIPTTQQEFWDQAGENLSSLSPDIAAKSADIAKSAFSNVFGILGWLLSALLFPVFFFYILKDFNRIKEAGFEMIPPRNRELIVSRLQEVDRVLAAFVRGQVTVCTFLAITYSVGLSFTGIDLAVVIGVVSGYAFVIPYAGTILGVVAGSAMAIVKFGLIDPDFVLKINPHLLGVWAVFGVVQFLESNVISPKIVGEQVGLHPVVMITAVIVGGTLFGFLGVLLAVPATAAGAVFWWAAWDHYKRSDFYVARR